MPTLLTGHCGTFLSALPVSWAPWDPPVIIALDIMRSDDHEFEDILAYIVMSGQPGLCRKTPLKNKQNKHVMYS